MLKRCLVIVFISSLAFFCLRPVLAVWDGNKYSSGSTLNPECSPGTSNCDVVPPLTATTSLLSGLADTSITSTIPNASMIVYDNGINKWKNVNVSGAVTINNSGVASILSAGSSQTGLLINTDWNTFNNK